MDKLMGDGFDPFTPPQRIAKSNRGVIKLKTYY
jgi:hypothetical protein